MAAPLISTKLHVPSRRSASVPRSRLAGRLDAPGRVALVAAPAGFGKTSILTEWLASLASGVRVAWVSLDERDNAEQQFWAYVLAALDTAVPGVSAGALLLLESNPLSIEAVIATLVNDLDAAETKIVLVLDDFHVIEGPAIPSEVAFLVEHLPANVRLVISSRADPALPLARLRSQGDLVELRAADLRFTPAEAAAYLRDVMGLELDDEAVAALGERTEGWIAAIQLAALSMQGRDDPAAFVAGFAGDDRHVVDYLVEEVLRRQPEQVRSFLLETSILSRMTGELCDAVTGTGGGASTLEALDRANLFLVPLDDHREWYRYHHLFADMLRRRLLEEPAERLDELHLRASVWFEQHGLVADAISHAIEGHAFDRAADLIAVAIPAMQQQRQEQTLVTWFEKLPADVIRARPGLSLGFAGVLLSSGRTDGVEALLHDAETAVGVPVENIRAIRNGVALYRGAQALNAGDLDTALVETGVAVELSAEGTDIERGSAAGLRGLVLWARGDLAAAEASWEVSLASLLRAGHRSDMLGGSIAIADIRLARGRLRDAEASYARALAIGEEAEPPLRGTADMHVGLADVLRERGDLEGARRQLAAAEALGEYSGLPQNRHRRRLAAARLLQSEGDAAAAIALLDEAERLYTPDFFPEVRPIAAVRARAFLSAGRLADARAWARRAGVSEHDELTYLREYEHITLARVLLAEATGAAGLAAAHRLLARMTDAAEKGGRGGSLLELLVLTAGVVHRMRSAGEGLVELRRAVELAEPEGYLRVFADEGEPIAQLVTKLGHRDGWSPYLRRLQSAGAGRPAAASVAHELIDPLTDREVEVVRLLASDLAGPAIARRLVVSLNTLRTHTKNVYAKLGVTSRRDAVRRATELGILSR